MLELHGSGGFDPDGGKSEGCRWHGICAALSVERGRAGCYDRRYEKRLAATASLNNFSTILPASVAGASVAGRIRTGHGKTRIRQEIDNMFLKNKIRQLCLAGALTFAACVPLAATASDRLSKVPG